MELQNVLSHIKNHVKADFISVRQVQRRGLGITVRNENFEGLGESLDAGLMVEVMIDGHIGYGATNSQDLNEILKTAETAKENSLKTAKFALTKMDLTQRPSTVGSYESPAQQSIDDFDPKLAVDLLMSLNKEMNQDAKIINRMASLSVNELKTHYLTTAGADIRQKIVYSRMALSVTATDGNDSQTRSFGEAMPSQFGLEIYEKNKLLVEAKRIANEVLNLLEAPDCPTETMDLILMPDQMYLQIHESIGHPLELDRILGDERNYAGWSFVTPKDFGTLQYGSKLMNITFDPTLSGEVATYFADDIGAKATKEFLIKDGLLERGLGSLESQKRLGLSGVASQRSTSWNRAPIDRMSNINLEPGNSTLEDMIKSVKRGVLMMTTRSWSIDDYRNKFQFGCEYGRLIEDGKLTSIVKNPNYRGITSPFWNKLKMVGDKSTFEIGGTSNCGKGEPNQVIFVGHASPACLFENVEVFGGGK